MIVGEAMQSGRLLLLTLASLTLALPSAVAQSFCAVEGSPSPHAQPVAPLSFVSQTRTVPVFFHIVQGTGETPVPLATILEQLNVLNLSFRSIRNEPAATPAFQFTLAGIDRVVNDAWAGQIEYGQLRSSPEGEMKETLAVDPERVLNVYVVRTRGGTGSRSYFPFLFSYSDPESNEINRAPNGPLSGVVLDLGSLPGGAGLNNQGKVLAHEVGHYMGLFHPFQDECAGGAPTTCAVAGDRVCDTPQHSGRIDRAICGSSSSCPFGQTPLGDNLMDVFLDPCRQTFTSGQNLRMATEGQAREELGATPRLGRMDDYDDMSEGVPPGLVERWLAPGLTWELDEPYPVRSPLRMEEVTIRARSGAYISVTSQLAASNTTLTALNVSEGWRGVRFEPGSGGSLIGVDIQRVAGDSPGGTATERGVTPAAIHVSDAIPTLRQVQVSDPISGGFVVGIYGTGPSTFLVAERVDVVGMPGGGIVLNAGARADVIGGQVEDNASGGLIAGSGARATLVPLPGPGGLPRGPAMHGNWTGFSASGGAEITYGRAGVYGGHGFASAQNNASRGVLATSGGVHVAGTASVYQRNRVVDNAPSNSLGNAFASGTGSRVWARCAWWGTPSGAVRAGSFSGGIVDASRWLTEDPWVNPAAACVGGEVSERRAGQAGAADEVLTSDDDPTLTDRLLRALDAELTEAVGEIQALIAEAPTSRAAAAAVGEAGRLAQAAEAPAAVVDAARAVVSDAAQSAIAALRAAGWQATLEIRRAFGDAHGALAAADALAVEGEHVAAEAARVGLLADLERFTEAVAALDALEALAPESAEAFLARALLAERGLVEPPSGGRVAAKVSTPPSVTTLAEEASSRSAVSVVPNPSRGRATVIVALPEAAASVVVDVLDSLGREVGRVFEGALGGGRHSFDLPTERVSPGVYTLRVVVRETAGDRLVTSRWTVLR